MVQIKSGGELYSVSSGKQVEWKDLPVWLKKEIAAQESATQLCISQRVELERCIQEQGFWEEDCVNLLAEYDKCETSQS